MLSHDNVTIYKARRKSAGLKVVQQTVSSMRRPEPQKVTAEKEPAAHGAGSNYINKKVSGSKVCLKKVRKQQ